MEANELRIGNYIFSEQKLFKLCINSIGYLKDKEYFEVITPIPLSEDIILKIGAIKKDHIWSDKSVSTGLLFFNGYFVENSKEGFLFCQLHYSGQGWFIKTIKYVHELQNLYFALTQTELTLS